MHVEYHRLLFAGFLQRLVIQSVQLLHCLGFCSLKTRHLRLCICYCLFLQDIFLLFIKIYLTDSDPFQDALSGTNNHFSVLPALLLCKLHHFIARFYRLAGKALDVAVLIRIADDHRCNSRLACLTDSFQICNNQKVSFFNLLFALYL